MQGQPDTHLCCLSADELELALQDGQQCVRARSGLARGLCWGPFPGHIQSRASSPGQAEPVRGPQPAPSSPADGAKE
ncbi:Zinc finger protein ZFPM1 [Galemys pyrenaicus]|uniref:Zinc finger protein ZFPM1 n=1 Tax=Galemys pyrenaicus TaxID=202257 RepID=A0A8J5ZVF1_GALPY|nr:Zinc finger protein ZFPM1 [Galemys pyrenaicus]